MSDTNYAPHGLTVGELLRAAGFRWHPGFSYWSREVGDVEVTLEPQVMNAGQFKLGIYRLQEAQLGVEVLVDVKPRP